MPSVNETQSIPKPPGDVFAVITDFNRYGEWMTIHGSFPDGPPESLEQGSSFRQQVSVMGMPAQVTWTVTEITDRSIDMSGQGPMGIELRTAFNVAEAGDGSEVTMSMELNGPPLAGPMGDTVAQHASKAARESLEKLAAIV
jgi:carbon monoxide dehydrogenase subunit G